jgi:hypothetical protein
MHATIKSVVASRDSITPRETVVFTAVIVSTVTQQAMPGREVFLSLNEGEYIAVVTDIRGEVSRIMGGAGGQVTGYVSFYIEVKNPGGTTQIRGKTVAVDLNKPGNALGSNG